MKTLTAAIVSTIALTCTGAALAQAPAQPAPAPAQTPAQPAPAGAAAAAPIAGTRIGYIDVQRVLARSAAGVAAREQLEREKATMQKEMDNKRTELEKLRDELEKKGPLMTADARREKQDAFDRKRRDAARLADDFGKELEKKEAELLQRVLRDVGGVIERVGREKGYYLILERGRGGVLYASTDADLTDEVIRAYDRENGTKGKK
jgi:outer membrane protein